MAGTKYICTKAWAKNKKDDLIMDWELKKYPVEIQRNNFELYVEEKPVTKDSKLVITTSTSVPTKESKPLILDSSKTKSSESIITG